MVRLRSPRAFFPWMWVVLILALPGCQQHFHADTVLHADGSIDRIIYQPAGGLPTVAADPKLWDQMAAPAEFEFPPGRQRDLPDQGKEYIIAHGRFASVDQIPDHYQLPLNEPGGSRLGRSYAKTDFVLVTEHHWQEVLTESVNINEARRVGRELLHLAAEFGVDVLNERFGPEYDFTAIIPWVDSEGAAWFGELYDALVETSLQPEAKRSAYFLARVATINESHGLLLQDASGKRFGESGFEQKDPQLQQQWLAFWESKLKQWVQRRDGRPVPPEVIQEVLESLDHPSEAESTNTPSALEEAAIRVVQRRYGSEEEVERVMREQVWPQVQKVFGVHLSHLLPQKFVYSMKMPGLIVETNGRLQSQQEVAWEFDGDSAFPSGRRMSCISLEPNREAQRQLLGDERIDTQAELVEFRALLADDQILATMRQCAEESSLEALQQLDSPQAARLRKLLQVDAIGRKSGP